jgi:hypothetical protein
LFWKLVVFFRRLGASSVAWKSFKEAYFAIFNKNFIFIFGDQKAV